MKIDPDPFTDSKAAARAAHGARHFPAAPDSPRRGARSGVGTGPVKPSNSVGRGTAGRLAKDAAPFVEEDPLEIHFERLGIGRLL